jgi:hypothetical protein
MNKSEKIMILKAKLRKLRKLAEAILKIAKKEA